MWSIEDLSQGALSALVSASAAINSAQQLGKTLAAITDAAARVMNAAGASVIMLDPVRGKQVFSAASGEAAGSLVGVEYDQGEGISGKVLRTGEAIIVHDVSRDEAHYKGIDRMTAATTRSLIAAPLIHQGRKLGVVEVINPLHAARFTDGDLELCRIFANLAAIAAANAQLHDRLQLENRGLKQELRGSARMVGDSAAMGRVRELIGRVCRSNATVLLTGETGTGKELAARMIHDGSPRAEGSFIAVNCAALPETLMESELFGHEAGAFTGAASAKPGRFELASGGTIFLDEIAEATADIQVKLLRVLEDRELVRLGGTRGVACDVRVVAATNRDLAAEMAEGRFRADLFYRLNVFPVPMPPLRDRREDIPLLVDHFVGSLAAEMKIPPPQIAPEAMAILTAHSYPGNVRELANVLERACLMCAGAEQAGGTAACIQPRDLPPEMTARVERPAGGGSALVDLEKSAILCTLRENGWNQSRTARVLGISRDNLRYRIKKYGITKPGRAGAD